MPVVEPEELKLDEATGKVELDKEHEAVMDVIEAYNTEPPKTGWRAGFMIQDGQDLWVRFGDVVDWVPFVKEGDWGKRFADRLNEKGRLQPVIVDDTGKSWLGQHVYWTSERKMKKWIDRQAERGHTLVFEVVS